MRYLSFCSHLRLASIGRRAGVDPMARSLARWHRARGGHSEAWPKSTKRAWQVEIGEGYSSPVVANGRAFLHSRRDPEEIVTAIDLASGKVVWQQKYPAAFTKNQYATAMAKGPNSTPLVAGGRLFTLGVTGILTAWNVADGTIAWRQDYSPRSTRRNCFAARRCRR